MNQQHLLKGLTDLTKSIDRLFGLIPADQLEYRPRENMRTLMELANHLAQVPAVDLAILQGKSQEEVRELERRLTRATPAELTAVWQEGVQAVAGYFAALTPEQFLTLEGEAFYGHAAPMHEWLLEIITHSYHHRSQVFTYLKIMGLPVDMFTLY